MQNFMHLQGRSAERDLAVGLMVPDIYADDVDGSTIGLTLLRGAIFAHHDPARPSRKRYHRYTDQGEHEFIIDLLLDPDVSPDALAARADLLSHPVHVWDRTVS